MKPVSVIVTTFNEEKFIVELIESLLNQTVNPKEIIVVDSYSTDNTFKILKKYQEKYSFIKIFQKKCNRSIGRNYAIGHSDSEIIAITDAGCVPNNDWLAKITEPLFKNQSDVVAGYYFGKANSIFEKCLIPFVLVMPDKTNNEFLPSTRSMSIKKSVWKDLGGFNITIDPGEDYEFSNRLIKYKYKIIFVKDALVGWYPRKDLLTSYRMFKSFAFADKIANSPRPRVKLTFIKYIALVCLGIASIIYQILTPLFIVGIILIIYVSINKNYKYINRPLALFFLPLIQATCDIAVMHGTLSGILYKITHR